MYKILDIGCGNRKYKNSVGMDIRWNSEADVIHSMDDVPYPFKNNEFDFVVMRDSIEHCIDIIPVLKEIYRICKNNAELHIETVYFTSRNLYIDHTHRRAFTSRSLDFLDKEKYSLISTKIIFPQTRLKLIYKIFGIEWIKNNKTDFYEKCLAWIFPAESIHFDLMIKK